VQIVTMILTKASVISYPTGILPKYSSGRIKSLSCELQSTEQQNNWFWNEFNKLAGRMLRGCQLSNTMFPHAKLLYYPYVSSSC